jgi:hypothetical protein
MNLLECELRQYAHIYIFSPNHQTIIRLRNYTGLKEYENHISSYFLETIYNESIQGVYGVQKYFPGHLNPITDA